MIAITIKSNTESNRNIYIYIYIYIYIALYIALYNMEIEVILCIENNMYF